MNLEVNFFPELRENTRMKISLLYLSSYVLFMVIIMFFPVNLTSHMVSIYLYLNNILSNIHLLVLLQAGGGPFEISRVYYLCAILFSHFRSSLLYFYKKP